jgi:hypothetical protein
VNVFGISPEGTARLLSGAFYLKGVISVQEEIHVDLMLRDAGSMRATADVSIPTPWGPLTVSGVKVISKDGKNPWVGFPSKEYTGRDGSKKYQKLIELPKPLQRVVSERVLSEYNKQLGQN